MKITPYPQNWIAQQTRTWADLEKDRATPIYLRETGQSSSARPGAPVGLALPIAAKDLDNGIITNRFAIAARPYADKVFADEINATSLELILSAEDIKDYWRQPYATDRLGGILSVFTSAGDAWDAWQGEDATEKFLASTSLAADAVALAADAAAPSGLNAALPYIHGAHILLSIGAGLVKIGVTVQKRNS
jgi:hypothetical protein